MAAAPAPAEGRTPAGIAPLILMVDDNPVNRKVGEMVLRRAGFRVVVAEDGPTGIAAALAHLPDAVLMDWQMPGMDGLEATRRLRATWPAGTPAPPIVALTANTMPGDREQCLAAGMDDYLAKPYRADILVAKIQQWLAARGQG
jgi:CheY-like chemotaxis protein